MNQIPNVGAVVRVTTKYPESYLFSKEPFVYHTHEGTVIPVPFTTAKQTFAMTGDSTTKMRVIDISYVEKIEFISGTGTAAASSRKARIFKVESKSKGRAYHVVFNNGAFMCDCIGFQYRKSCRHMKAVAETIKRGKVA